ncbi:MAG: helix-turn-helix transcriptional regulator [Granulosicoccaceae bacterium]
MNVLVASTLDSNPFLTVPQLAALLHINEKKVYQLAGDGELPGTKITGKWIFPRRLIEDWITENCHSGVLNDRLIVTGSDDRLIHRVFNRYSAEVQNNALVSYSPCGTRHGLRMLDIRRADACFINWGASDQDARRHLGLLRSYKNHSDWVVLRGLQRQQGLIVSSPLASTHSTPLGLLSDRTLTWALRNEDSGNNRLLLDTCSEHEIDLNKLKEGARCNSERGAVAAVCKGVVDVTCGAKSSASEFNLGFIPLASVSLDLVTNKQTYFRTLLQHLIIRLQHNDAQPLADDLGGYSVPNTLELITLG